VSRYSEADWDSKTGVAWDSEKPYTSKGSRRARRVFEPKTVFDIFCHYDLLFSMIKAYHKKGNLILILTAISVCNEFAKNVHNTNYSKVPHPTPVFFLC